MKIAFVGKGGSGKTTLAALFALYAAGTGKEVLAVDADLNMHLPELLGFGPVPEDTHISSPNAAEWIKQHLRGTNNRIASAAHFRKTTPPGHGSRLIQITDDRDPLLAQFALRHDNLRAMVVGTYSEDGIGTSCYHNNLAIFENVLSHSLDDGAVIVADMVAGIDAFASTLHAQFDLLCLVIEPTRRSVEVFHQYEALMREAELENSLAVIGNKITSEADRQFIRDQVPEKYLLGFLGDSSYVREHDRTGGAFAIEKLEDENCRLLDTILKKLETARVKPDLRLKHLWDLHVRYVAQPSIAERLGDLRSQIDPDFSYSRLET